MTMDAAGCVAYIAGQVISHEENLAREVAAARIDDPAAWVVSLERAVSRPAARPANPATPS
jgi:hypothetical protein